MPIFASTFEAQEAEVQTVYLYGLDGLPISFEQGRELIADVPSRLIGETIVNTTEGELRVITAHMVIDQSPCTETGREHIPLLYATNVFSSRAQFPVVACMYTSRVGAALGHAAVVVDTVATAPGKVLTLDEVLDPQAAA